MVSNSGYVPLHSANYVYKTMDTNACLIGIHGLPYVPWDNVQAAAGQSRNGYCTHSSTLFLTWHRAYLALFEVSRAICISRFSVIYKATANTIREGDRSCE